MTKLKTGRLSFEEQAYISENSSRNINDLAKEMNRNPETIAKYIRLNAGESTKNVFGENEQNLELTKLPFWSDIMSQFDADERNKIIFDWNKMIEQFMGDVQYSEQMQILDLIKYDVLMNRILRSRHQISEEIERLENLSKDEQSKDIDDRNTSFISNCEIQIANLRTSLETGVRQYKDLSVEKNKLFEKLKATRDQRLKVLENTKENFPQWLQKLLKDPYLQKSCGERMAKMRQAIDKERERLAEYHTYEDGAVDRPFLTPDVVLEKDEN